PGSAPAARRARQTSYALRPRRSTRARPCSRHRARRPTRARSRPRRLWLLLLRELRLLRIALGLQLRRLLILLERLRFQLVDGLLPALPHPRHRARAAPPRRQRRPIQPCLRGERRLLLRALRADLRLEQIDLRLQTLDPLLARDLELRHLHLRVGLDLVGFDDLGLCLQFLGQQVNQLLRLRELLLHLLRGRPLTLVLLELRRGGCFW